MTNLIWVVFDEKSIDFVLVVANVILVVDNTIIYCAVSTVILSAVLAILHKGFSLNLVLKESIFKGVQMTISIVGAVVIEPSRFHFIGEIHSFFVLFFENDSLEYFPRMACLFEQRFDFYCQFHLDGTTIR